MASENKTRPTGAAVDAFIDAVEPERRREDARAVVAFCRDITGVEPEMWGPSIIGFGSHHYRYESGREGDMPAVGFSPRKANLVFYGLSDAEAYDEKLARLGKHKTGVGCLYVNKLADIDLAVLKGLIAEAFAARAGAPGP